MSNTNSSQQTQILMYQRSSSVGGGPSGNSHDGYSS